MGNKWKKNLSMQRYHNFDYLPVFKIWYYTKYSKPSWNTKKLHHRCMHGMTTCFVSREEKKRILDSDRKLKVFSRKEMRSGRESSKARKESQGNAIFPVETDGWMIGRRTNERGSGGTDRQASIQASKRTNRVGRSRQQPAGFIAMSWQRCVVHRRIYIPSWRGAVRHGMARFGAIRFDSTRLSAVLGTNHVTLLYANLLFDGHRAGRFCLLPLSLFSLSHHFYTFFRIF